MTKTVTVDDHRREGKRSALCVFDYLLLLLLFSFCATLVSKTNSLFSNAEYIDILLSYKEAHHNCQEAGRIYVYHFPQRHLANRRTLVEVSQRVLGSV